MDWFRCLIVLINVILSSYSVNISLPVTESFKVAEDVVRPHRHHHGQTMLEKKENKSVQLTTESVITTTEIDSRDLTDEPVNFPPIILKRIQKIAITAGKVLNFSISPETFYDREDGNNLVIELKDNKNKRLSNSSWIQFNGREIIAIPLDEHVSKWNFFITATDSGNETVQDQLEIIVRQDKAYRTVNHEFVLEFECTVPNLLRLQIILIDTLKRFFNRTQSEVTVRQAAISRINLLPNVTYEKLVFAWSNDSLPREQCPKNEIDDLFLALSPKFDGILSTVFLGLLTDYGLKIRNARISWHGLNQCDNLERIVPERVTLPPNYTPLLRNAIDKLDAFAGELFVFKVPYDTFFDMEDGSTQNMRLQVFGKNHEFLPNDFWLQFDSNNQEFYGLPLVENVGEFELFLKCSDRGNLTSFDALVIQVHPVPKINSNVKFSATLSVNYYQLSPIIKRTFIEMIVATISPQFNCSILRVMEIYQNPTTTLVWVNKTLPTNSCATEDINDLKSSFYNRKLGLYDQIKISDGVSDNIRFAILSIDIEFIGSCKTLETVMTDFHVVENDYDISLKQMTKHEEDEAIYKDILSHSDNNDVLKVSQQEYFLTFLLPIVLMVSALMVSSCLACFLVRKRKKSVRNKSNVLLSVNSNGGVPIIFQDELIEDQQAYGASMPAIFDQEKPPLTPPKLFTNRPIVGSRRDYVSGGQCENLLKKPPPPYNSGR